jgi:phage-related tail fiber protein
MAAPSVPAGFLECNGATVKRSDYPALFSLIGTTYGAGDSSTTFTLPDLRGEFIRGWDSGRTIDSGRALGSLQLDSIQNIQGSLGLDDASISIPFTGPFYNAGRTNNTGARFSIGRGVKVGFDSSRTVRASTETRPRNVSLLYCVKY